MAARFKRRKRLINEDQYRRLIKGSKDADVVKRWRKALEEDPKCHCPWVDKDPELLTGIDWKSIWAWLVNNWPMILKLLLSLLVFLDENPAEEEK